MGDVITDPDLIKQLEAQSGAITDPDLISKLEDASTQPGMFANMPGPMKAIGTGLVKGGAMMGGMAGDVTNMLASGYDAAVKNLPPSWQPETQSNQTLSGLVTGQPAHQPGAETLKGYGHIPTTEDIEGTIQNAAGEQFYQPQNRLEQGLETAAEFIPGAAVGSSEASLPMRVAKWGVAPGAAVAGVNAVPALDEHPYIKSGLDVALGAVAPSAFQKTIAPNAARILSNPTRMGQVENLRAAGVTPSAGDVTNLKQLQTTEQDLAPELREQQLRDFTQAATGRVGVPTDSVTIGQGGNLPQSFRDVGNQYDQVASRNTWYPGFPQQAGQVGTHDPFYQELADLYHQFHGPPGSTTPGTYSQQSLNALDSALERVMNTVQPGAVSGADYQTLRSDLRRDAMGAQDPQVSEALHGVTNAMDDSFERSLQMQGSPDAGMMPELNRQYRGLLTLQDARLKAGPATQGYITPQNLRQSTINVYGKNAYMNGETPFTDLADSGSAVLSPRPDSGTSSHMNVENKVNAVSRAIAAPLGAAAGRYTSGGQGEGDVFGLLAGEALAPIINGPVRAGLKAVTTSAPAQSRLMSTWGGMPTAQDAMVQALLRGEPIAHAALPQPSIPLDPRYGQPQ